LAESYCLLSGTLLLVILYSNYFLFISNSIWSRLGFLAVCIELVFFAICIAAVATTYVGYARNLSRYYKALSRKALQEQIRKQFQQIVVDWIVWVIIVGLTIVLLNAFPTILTGPPISAMDLALLCVWFLAILMKSLRTARWHHTLAMLNEPAAQDQKGGML